MYLVGGEGEGQPTRLLSHVCMLQLRLEDQIILLGHVPMDCGERGAWRVGQMWRPKCHAWI